MSITASCGNCGKTYQAPDRMAGKSVRCKACGEIFRIDSGDGGVDLDALSQSVSDEEFPTHQASAMHGKAIGGPSLDEHGRARIHRDDDVEAFHVAGNRVGSQRSNYRFRYPGAKAVDQLLPWVLVILAFFLVGNASMTSEAVIGETPPTGVGISRMLILFAAYLFIIFPVSHVAIKMAATKMRFSLPNAAVWRSFAAFTPVLMMGGWLFVRSGGAGIALTMGLLVGVALAIGAVAVLFRVFPNEVPTVAAYSAVGALGSSIFAALAIVAINLIAVSLAGMDKNPTLFVSPIAVGLNWIEKPATPVAIAPKNRTTTTPANTTAPVVETPPTVPVPPANLSPLTTIALPKPAADETQLLSALQLAPVTAGFDVVVLPPVESAAMAIVRIPSGGVVEVWDRGTWRQPTTQKGRGFDFGQGALVVNTTGRRVFRLVRTPTDRLEEVTLGNIAGRAPITMVGAATNRSVLGFVSDTDIIVRSYDNGGMAFERYNIVTGDQVYPPTPFKNAGSQGTIANITVEMHPSTLRVLPDGSGYLIACRDASAPDNPARLALYKSGEFNRAESVRDIPFNSRYSFRPLGMAVRSSGKVALLLDAAGEGYFTVWETRDVMLADGRKPASEKPTLDVKIGVLSDLRPPVWDDAVDPILWLDEDTVLLYGKLVIDTRTGRRLGTISIPNVTAQFPAGDGAAMLLQSQGGLSSLVIATFDQEALKKSRGE